MLSRLAAAGLSTAAPGRHPEKSQISTGTREKEEGRSQVAFRPGAPFLVASLKTGHSGVYAPHAFGASSGAIYLGYYPWPDDFFRATDSAVYLGYHPWPRSYENYPNPAVLLRSYDNGVTWRNLGERPNFGYFFCETKNGEVLAIDCIGRRRMNGDYVVEAQKFFPDRRTPPEALRVKLLGFRPGQEPFFHLNRAVRLANGNLLAATYAVSEGATQMMMDSMPLPAPTRIVCLSSKDEGRSWEFISEVARRTGTLGGFRVP